MRVRHMLELKDIFRLPRSTDWSGSSPPTPPGWLSRFRDTTESGPDAVPMKG